MNYEDQALEEGSPNEPNRRSRALAVVGVITAVGVVAGVAYLYVTSLVKPDLKVVERAGPAAGQLVRGHVKNQAFGPRWANHRLIDIAPYTRSV